ncbi:transcriptional regulator [Streptomyces sp. NPDC048436]|uniref:transcriptional regulator n=1 Tax=Streptomyces sp. NPDC048436 TaxID=3365550 RepID=UPI0037181ECB
MTSAHLQDGDDSLQFFQSREYLLHTPAQQVAVSDLEISYTPRSTGTDPDHIRALAGTESALPAILVHRDTMAVIDGVHRLYAARERGDALIEVQFFDGTETEARILAVSVNSTHGLALSPADRHRAAREVITARPHWSDRAIATITGVSARRVAEIRRGLPATDTPLGVRIGRDGRRRPVDPARGRNRAAELLHNNPQASLRWIAREAGVSPATVAAVRDNLSPGQTPAPGIASAALSELDTESARALLRRTAALRRDPSLRQNERGRQVLRMIDAWAMFARESEEIAQVLPAHCRRPVVELVRGYHQALHHVINRFDPDAPSRSTV